MVTLKLYVEGGGNHDLDSAVRRGFKFFLLSAGFKGRLPKVIACGSRKSAYDDYCLAVNDKEPAMLLIDSEAPVREQFENGDFREWKPWEQLQSRKDHLDNQCDNWERVGANTDCHLMVQMMETWFLADVEAMRKYFGSGFNDHNFPGISENIENIAKGKIVDILAYSSKESKKEGYSKGRDSFAILGMINPDKVKERSKWANRFITLLDERLSMKPR